MSLLVAFPPYDWWAAAPVGVAMLALVVRRRSVRAGASLGAATGLVFFVPLLSFTGLQIGWWPWWLLAGVQALFLAALGAYLAACSVLADRHAWLWPLISAAGWVAQEALRSRVPFGGFPWGRLAFSQADAPAVRLAAVAGAPAVTFAVALTGGVLAVVVWRTAVEGNGRRHLRWSAAWVAGAGAVSVAGLLVPVGGTDSGRPVVVAVVQGNVPRIGLDFNAQRRAVLDNHVTATERLAQDVKHGVRPRPDLVIWPENSSDIDPLVHADAAARIDDAARAIGVPILVGAVLQGPGQGRARNASLTWLPDGGPADTYIKRHPVPFAEFVPMRGLIRRVTTLVDRVRADFVAGESPAVTDMAGTKVGPVICFEVAYDGLVRDTVRNGADLIAVQTNNATFNEAEATQQLAMVRLRAVEHGRAAVMASTVGVSAFALPDGSLHDATAWNTQAVAVRTLPVGQARTLATRLGAAPEWSAVVVAGFILAAVARSRLRLRRATAQRAVVEPLSLSAADGRS
ncbi:apolipoprotein N-acyltransferase [Spirilliplanes yamanashiensis]|uniref:apolipoprotein N-acyltransferase n=1 Tax=Spirilliplanes yamanashiensis TaxID=42233 RepID=UPI001EF2342E|nr:apolipoprotein N-acyltransferase [Spirilliplanes yamanashiensis]MDP9818378.1 apolipoprotein N-acyltransferase [Spirilliplanes yamanashiensis]